jgi:hypothetical protein
MTSRDARAQRITDHHEFIKFCRHSNRYVSSKMTRNVAYKTDRDGIKVPIAKQELLLENKIYLHPESAAFLFHIEGCPRKLLMYIIYFELDVSFCIFKFNAQTIQSFKSYCNLFGGGYETSVIKKAIRELVDRNLVCNVSRGKYMVNPLLIGGKTRDGRRELIYQYDDLGLRKKKDAVLQLYPVYIK